MNRQPRKTRPTIGRRPSFAGIATADLQPLQRAIRFFGSQAKLADALEVASPAVSYWLKNGVPVERCVQIERLTKRKVKARELRPDVFGATK